jgi:hypothetical protein
MVRTHLKQTTIGKKKREYMHFTRLDSKFYQVYKSPQNSYVGFACKKPRTTNSLCSKLIDSTLSSINGL